MKRILILVIALIMTLCGVPFLAIIFSSVMSLFFRFQNPEILIIGFLSDILYQSFLSVAPLHIPLYTLGSLGIFVLMQIFKKNLIHYV